MTGDSSLDSLNVSSLSSVDGTFMLSDNLSLDSVSADTLTTAGGDFVITDNEALTSVDITTLSSVGGTMELSNNDLLTSIDASTLESTGGDLILSDNTSLSSVSVTSLSSVGGDMMITNDPLLTDVTATSLSSTGGDLLISSNETLSSVSLTNLTSVGGDLQLVDNPDLTSTDLTSLSSVGGTATIESGDTTLDVSGATVEGDMTLFGSGTESITAMTAEGTTDVTLLNTEATVNVALSDSAFSSPTTFSVSHEDPATLTTESGTTATGESTLVEPLAAYTFSFATQTLSDPADLTMEVETAQLTAEEQSALTDALASGAVTLAVKDATGNTYHAVPLCAEGQTPETDGCADIVALDADGNRVAADGSVMPALLQLTTSVDQFSTWAVAILIDFTADARPRTDNNLLNPSASGLFPVAVFGSELFDVKRIDPLSLSFGPADAPTAHDLSRARTYHRHVRDHDGDGIEDLEVHFRMRESGVTYEDIEACLRGTLRNGTAFETCTAVNTPLGGG